MSWVYGHYKYVYFYSASESDDYRRQIMTIKVDSRAVRAKLVQNILRVGEWRE